MPRKQFSKTVYGRGGSTHQVHIMRGKQSPKNEELESYKDAVWDYLLQHCDITENGSFFIKFHASTRASFEKHVKARWKHGYHRHDDRMDFTHKQKEKDAEARRTAHLSRKAAKRRKYKLSKEEQAKVRAALDEQKRLQAMSPLKRFVHSCIMQPVAKKWYTIHNLYVKKIATKKDIDTQEQE